MTQAYPGGDIPQPGQKDRHAMGIRPLYMFRKMSPHGRWWWTPSGRLSLIIKLLAEEAAGDALRCAGHPA
jgi:hypothetical protein